MIHHKAYRRVIGDNEHVTVLEPIVTELMIGTTNEIARHTARYDLAGLT